jgi:hypothetical protein
MPGRSLAAVECKSIGGGVLEVTVRGVLTCDSLRAAMREAMPHQNEADACVIR